MRNFELDPILVTEEEFEVIQARTDMKVEYMDGQILYSSSTSRRHNDIVRDISLEVRSYLADKPCDSYTEQIEVLMKNNRHRCRFKPDLFVVCDGEYETEGETIVGIPKIIFEVVSKGNSSHDTVYKMDKYWQFGVREYNIVYQNGKIIQYLLEDGEYIPNETYNKDDTFKSVVLKDFEMDLNMIFYKESDLKDDEEFLNKRKKWLINRGSTVEIAINEKALEIARNLLDILDDEIIAVKTGLNIDDVKSLRLKDKR